MKTEKLNKQNIDGLITSFLFKNRTGFKGNTILFHCNNTLSTQDYLKDFVNEKANNSNYVDLEVHSLDNSNYQDGDVINFLNLKYKIISDSEKKYLVFRTFEKFSNDDKKILSLSNSLNEQINYLFVGLVKK